MLSNSGCVASVMGYDAQAALANTLYRVKVPRAELIGLPVGGYDSIMPFGTASLLRSPLLPDCCVGPLLAAHPSDPALCFTSLYLVITALLGRVPASQVVIGGRWAPVWGQQAGSEQRPQVQTCSWAAVVHGRVVCGCVSVL